MPRRPSGRSACISRADLSKPVFAQLTGPVVMPFNVQKQTALLSLMARRVPRLALGFGPEQARIVSVVDDTGTTTVTIITASDNNPQAFAEVLHACLFTLRQRVNLSVHVYAAGSRSNHGPWQPLPWHGEKT